MDTLAKLEKWLEENCYNFQFITIGRHKAQEGTVIECEHGSYNWCYSERGRKTIIASFKTEKDLVGYAYKALLSDQWARSHLLVLTFDKEKVGETGKLLEDMGIEFLRNDIPNYRDGRRAYRIFVFGCDIKKVEHLKCNLTYPL